MKVSLNYGTRGVEIALPDRADVQVIRKREMPVVSDSRRAVTDALDSPVDASSLEVLAAQASTACIAICDITRPVPNGLFLRPLIERLIQSGMDRSAITVVVATGLHRPNLGDELAELVGDPWVLENVNVVNHDGRCDADHVRLGVTSTRGTVVRLDRRIVDADLKIVTGLVEPHFMAGYSGGRKVIAPGLAHAETITTFHSARFMADPAAASCNLDGNPLHEEQLEIVRMLGDVYAINTVIDEQRALSYVNFGEVLSSHMAAVEFVKDYCCVALPRRFHTVVTSAAGYPLDKTYYQTVKGMVGPLDILEPGGNLIIASECSEGMGSKDFVASQRRLLDEGPSAFMERILGKSHADIDEWQTQMQLKPMEIGSVQLFSDRLPTENHSLTGVEMVSSVEAAIERSLTQSPDGAVAVIPEGPYVVPQYRPDSS